MSNKTNIVFVFINVILNYNIFFFRCSFDFLFVDENHYVFSALVKHNKKFQPTEKGSNCTSNLDSWTYNNFITNLNFRAYMLWWNKMKWFPGWMASWTHFKGKWKWVQLRTFEYILLYKWAEYVFLIPAESRQKQKLKNKNAKREHIGSAIISIKSLLQPTEGFNFSPHGTWKFYSNLKDFFF